MSDQHTAGHSSSGHEHHPAGHSPGVPVIGMGLLVLLSLVGVAWHQWQAPADAASEVVTAPVIAQRDLLFRDLEDGRVAVVEAGSGAAVLTLPVGQQGFVRATMRGLARARSARGIGQDIPFRLTRHDNGQLLLEDLATGQVVDLWAFGSTNAADFELLINQPIPVGGGALSYSDATPAVRQSDHEH